MILEEIEKRLSQEWKDLLSPYLENGGKENLKELDVCLKNIGTENYYPCISKVFRPFTIGKCKKPSEIKVVIIGQDPYEDQTKATGLAFSHDKNLPKNDKYKDSVTNIFKAIQNDIGGTIPSTGNLEYLAEQGVLLINRVFTYAKKEPRNERYREGMRCCWKQFSANLIRILAEENENIVFMLWGEDAKSIKAHINCEKHCPLYAWHPSNRNENKEGKYADENKLSNKKHFSQANCYLREHKREEIDWCPKK